MDETALLIGAQKNGGTLAYSHLVMVAINTMNGPALLALPSVFQSAGWMMSLFGLSAAAALTGVFRLNIKINCFEVRNVNS